MGVWVGGWMDGWMDGRENKVGVVGGFLSWVSKPPVSLEAVLVVLSLALRYIPLRLSSSFKTIFFVNVITV